MTALRQEKETQYNIDILPHLKPIYENPRPVNLLVGNRGGGKTENTALYIIHSLMTGRGNWIMAREDKDKVYDTCYSVIWRAIESLNLQKHFKEVKSELRIICKLTGCQIVGVGLNNPDNIKAMSGFRFLWIEEADQIKHIAFTKSLASLRTNNNDSVEVWLTTNYKSASHWIKKHIWDEAKTNPDIQAVDVRWQDNPKQKADWGEFLLTATKGNPVAYQRDYVGEWMEIDASRVMPNLEQKELIASYFSELRVTFYFISGRFYAILAGFSKSLNQVHLFKESFADASLNNIEGVLNEWKNEFGYFKVFITSDAWSTALKKKNFTTKPVSELDEGTWGDWFRTYEVTCDASCEILLKQSEETLYRVNEDTGGLFNSIDNKEVGTFYSLAACSLLFA